jgi:hypothetical protein
MGAGSLSERGVEKPGAGEGEVSPPFDGGCVCGGVRYRLEAEPLTLYACHCTDCQRQSGSSFGLSMIVPRPALVIVAGEPRTFTLSLADGRRKSGRFCGDCGTRLWGEPVKIPEVAVLRPGTLDDTTWLHPVGHIWTASAQAWVRIPDDALTYPGQPDEMRSLIEAWRARSEKRA